MARPLRTQERIPPVRPRHRTWMGAMVCASLAWGVWWAALALAQWAPSALPALGTLAWISGVPALAGLVMGLLTLRAKDVWIFLASIPILANGLVLALPVLFGERLQDLLAVAS